MVRTCSIILSFGQSKHAVDIDLWYYVPYHIAFYQGYSVLVVDCVVLDIIGAVENILGVERSTLY